MVNFCLSNPCHNNGLCISNASGFTCICPPMFTGTFCNIQVNPCTSSPCGNGQCNSLNNGTLGFLCTCLPGFTGPK